MALATSLTGRAARAAASACAAADAAPAAFAAEALTGVRNVYALGTQDAATTAHAALAAAAVAPGVRLGAARGAASGATNALFLVGYALALFYGGHKVASGAASWGAVVNALFAAMSAGAALVAALPAASSWQGAMAAGGRLLAVIDG